MELTIYIVVAAVVLASALYFSNRQASGEWVSLEGMVVRTGMSSDYDGNHPLIIVELPDGSQQQVPISPAQLARCARGDTIALIQQGLTYRVALTGCQTGN